MPDERKGRSAHRGTAGQAKAARPEEDPGDAADRPLTEEEAAPWRAIGRIIQAARPQLARLRPQLDRLRIGKASPDEGARRAWARVGRMSPAEAFENIEIIEEMRDPPKPRGPQPGKVRRYEDLDRPLRAELERRVAGGEAPHTVARELAMDLHAKHGAAAGTSVNAIKVRLLKYSNLN